MTLLVLFVLAQHPGESLGRGQVALEQFRPDEAVTYFEDARKRGPLLHAQLLMLYEGLGTAYAYLGKQDASEEAFTRLLELDPRHILPYTLSPKVTFLFEKVRRASEQRVPPALELRWAHDSFAEKPLRVEVATVGAGFQLSTVRLLHRRKGDPTFSRVDAPLSDGVAELTLAPLDPEGPLTRELFGFALDVMGNEILALASEVAPREVTLKTDTTPKWYARWWVWVTAGAVLAAATGVTTYFLIQPAPTTVPATLRTTTF